MSKTQSIGIKERSQLVRLQNGKVAGRVEDGVFVKPVRGSKHMLRIPRAWAVDAEAYDSIRPNINLIVVQDEESGFSYRATPETFDAFRGSLDRGFGRQYFLPLERWQVWRKDECQLSLNLVYGADDGRRFNGWSR
jgi:hypothetical protein